MAFLRLTGPCDLVEKRNTPDSPVNRSSRTSLQNWFALV